LTIRRCDVDENENNKVEKFRVVTLLTEFEKECLKELAWKSGRSMASYLRYILISEIEEAGYAEAVE